MRTLFLVFIFTSYVFTLFTWVEKHSMGSDDVWTADSFYVSSDQSDGNEEEQEKKDDKDAFEESIQYALALVFDSSRSKPSSFYETPRVRLITDRLFKPPKI